MKSFLSLLLITTTCLGTAWAQFGGGKHSEKFEQLEYELRDPNKYRTASGAPGIEYWQNTADYIIDVTLDDENQKITGEETITYTNNSPDPLTYIWLQLDQNVREKGSDAQITQTNQIRSMMHPYFMFRQGIFENEFDGGHKIEFVKDTEGNNLGYAVNKTMMIVDLPEALNTGESFSFKIAWYYNINDRMAIGGRSGYEYFPEDDNYLYTIAQFFPRMCVYNDYEGWQNKQFLGSGEFTVPFGNYEVSITVPSDHVMEATGELQNPEEVLSEVELERYNRAINSDEPVIIVTQEEATAKESKRATDTKTWKYKAQDVRDFGFATSRKFIWDAMGVDIEGRDDRALAISLYPKEGNPLWEEYSTRAVAHTLQVYSRFTFPYPYPKAVSVHAAAIGMEYPMICFNFGRPREDGSYSDETKYGMLGVIIHEVGHNFFPMIVNSDERQWTWMDEGLNTFVEYLTSIEFDSEFPARGGVPNEITPYMRLDRETISPIMTNSEQVQRLGPNAYSKPATALNILRETVMGRELFDRAFKEYSRRWMFKHPTPADFFRTMEDASGVDLDWYWRGWFYGVDHVDFALSDVATYKLSQEAPKKEVESVEEIEEVVEVRKKKKKKKKKKGAEEEATEVVQEVVEKKEFDTFYYPFDLGPIDPELWYYQVTIDNVGGLVMPVILELTYEDGTSEVKRFPAEIWRKNDQQMTKVFPSEQKIVRITVDPNLETADTDLSNNVWPPEQAESRFQQFKADQ